MQTLLSIGALLVTATLIAIGVLWVTARAGQASSDQPDASEGGDTATGLGDSQRAEPRTEAAYLPAVVASFAIVIATLCCVWALRLRELGAKGLLPMLVLFGLVVVASLYLWRNRDAQWGN